MDGLMAYAVAELILSVHIALSNLLVLWVYVRWKHVRTVTNSYIFSLALTDFLSGLPKRHACNPAELFLCLN